MNYVQLIKILTTWYVESKEYEVLYHLYTLFSIGIPNTYIYKFPKYSYFTSFENFKDNNDSVMVFDTYLEKLTTLFKKRSRFKKLEAWNTYGYSLSSR